MIIFYIYPKAPFTRLASIQRLVVNITLEPVLINNSSSSSSLEPSSTMLPFLVLVARLHATRHLKEYKILLLWLCALSLVENKCTVLLKSSFVGVSSQIGILIIRRFQSSIFGFASLKFVRSSRNLCWSMSSPSWQNILSNVTTILNSCHNIFSYLWLAYASLSLTGGN